MKSPVAYSSFDVHPNIMYAEQEIQQDQAKQNPKNRMRLTCYFKGKWQSYISGKAVVFNIHSVVGHSGYPTVFKGEVLTILQTC